MGIFDNIFGSKKEAATEKEATIWTPLTAVAQLDEIDTESQSKTIAIFKHSTRCGISRMVIKDFEKNFSLSEDQIKLYYLDLLNHRDISAEIASRYSVIHESPQLVVIKEAKAVAYDSHSAINELDLQQFI